MFPIIFPDKKRPEIRYLNIGQEKTSIPQEKGKSHLDRETYVARFGKENIEELERLLKTPNGQQRIVVEDLVSKGNTLHLTRDLPYVLDPENHYGIFLFDQDRDYDIMPWSSYQTLAADNKSHWQNPSFLAKPELNPRLRKKGIQLRIEMDLLAGEIASERGVTIQPVHRYDLEAIK